MIESDAIAGDRGLRPNPFSTRAVRPGALEFVFPQGQSPQKLVEKLRSLEWRGQILGAHGSGKSTLLKAIEPALSAAGRRVLAISLRDGQRRLPPPWPPRDASNLVVLVDGYEQLCAWSRWRLRRYCRRHHCGLVITSHADAGLPNLWVTAPDESLLAELARRLLQGDSRIGKDDIARTFAARGANLREALFDLYDLYEQRQRRPDATGVAPRSDAG